ncbi:hypothetical protein KTR66_06860 [Roseococcus sp. SDR]|uniref:hypothetical protein n=1 Tax=Roseococcus sp. SDR TaxID=2835532 RepID=UPI001BCD1B38|nr:hypothetical protein [Roseococcus sp. SDR]MBS7789706.1 hypothetical protein [Roseococcus sp. SDR]MBV1845020.1 hypothetical protein [Roseococcus sp. SDR]
MERIALLAIGVVLLAGPVAAIWYFAMGALGITLMVVVMVFGGGALAAGFGYEPPPPQVDPNAPAGPVPPRYDGGGDTGAGTSGHSGGGSGGNEGGGGGESG